MSDQLPAKRENIDVDKRGLRIRSLTDLARLAEGMVVGGIAPKGMTKEAALGVMAFGMELGLSPIQSLRDICFINGRPSAYGDAVSGLLNHSGLLACAPEVTYSKDRQSCRVVLRRKGLPGEFVGEYDMGKAKQANLICKDNWRMYPERMLKWRAFSYAARDGFSDVLKGLTTREEAQDYAEDERAIERRPVQLLQSLPAAEEIREIRSPGPALDPVMCMRPEDEELNDQAERSEQEAIAASPGKELPPISKRYVDVLAENLGEIVDRPSPQALTPPPRPGPNGAALWDRWTKMRARLKPEELKQVRDVTGINFISQKLTAAQLDSVVSAATEIMEKE